MGIMQIAKRKVGLIAMLATFAMLTVSCNGANGQPISLEDIERFATETAQASSAENTEEVTPFPTSTTVPPTPTTIPPTDTALPALPTGLPAVTRISFVPGATYGTARGTIAAGETQDFVLGALIGQPLQASVSSPNNDVTMSITSEDGIELLPAEQNWSTWQGSLPATQDYFFKIIGGSSSSTFSFWVTIPSRIKFELGATSATISGKTVDGYIASYVVAAQGGQTMDILLTPDPDKAALTIWGFSDGQPFMRSIMGSTTFNMQLPSTQDYIINVVPQGGQEVDFTLKVDIK